jgi:hypothetical protein
MILRRIVLGFVFLTLFLTQAGNASDSRPPIPNVDFGYLGSGCSDRIHLSDNADSLLHKTTWKLTHYADLDAFVRLNFPVGSPEKRLTKWLNSQEFLEPDFGFVTPLFSAAEISEEREFRRENGLLLFGAQKNYSSVLGDVRHRITWRVDYCGNIAEIHAAHKYFLPFS